MSPVTFSVCQLFSSDYSHHLIPPPHKTTSSVHRASLPPKPESSSPIASHTSNISTSSRISGVVSSSNVVRIDSSSRTPIAQFASSCKSCFTRMLWLSPLWCCSQNHAANGSSSGATTGAHTPAHTSGSGDSTPTTSDSNMQALLIDEADEVVEKIRRASFAKPVIAPLPPVREATSTGLSKEHSEQGRVKGKVYLQYLQAASKTGFCTFLLVMISSQVVSVMSTYMLRLWGEGNRESGSNAGLGDPRLLGYGFFCLLSILMTATAGLLLWVLCSLRSSKYLHDAVRSSISRCRGRVNELSDRCWTRS